MSDILSDKQIDDWLQFFSEDDENQITQSAVIDLCNQAKEANALRAAITQEPAAWLVKVKSAGQIREFASLPGWVLAPDETLVSETPLLAIMGGAK